MDTKKEQPKKFQKCIARCNIVNKEKVFKIIEETNQITAHLPSQVKKWNEAAGVQAKKNYELYLWQEVKASKGKASEEKK